MNLHTRSIMSYNDGKRKISPSTFEQMGLKRRVNPQIVMRVAPGLATAGTHGFAIAAEGTSGFAAPGFAIAAEGPHGFAAQGFAIAGPSGFATPSVATPGVATQPFGFRLH